MNLPGLDFTNASAKPQCDVGYGIYQTIHHILIEQAVKDREDAHDPARKIDEAVDHILIKPGQNLIPDKQSFYKSGAVNFIKIILV
ncbi:hypothetical protein BMS3Abin05_00638 [bacterium BMS3Abin05]|nr:hypothetical protein BMS3Abin05_00638 [bacterium BMS3Abin05]